MIFRINIVQRTYFWVGDQGPGLAQAHLKVPSLLLSFTSRHLWLIWIVLLHTLVVFWYIFISDVRHDCVVQFKCGCITASNSSCCVFVLWLIGEHLAFVKEMHSWIKKNAHLLSSWKVNNKPHKRCRNISGQSYNGSTIENYNRKLFIRLATGSNNLVPIMP